MFARVTTFYCAEHTSALVHSKVEQVDRPAVEADPDNRGLLALVDEERSLVLAISYWDDASSSSDERLTAARNLVAESADEQLSTGLFHVVGRDEATALRVQARTTLEVLELHVPQADVERVAYRLAFSDDAEARPTREPGVEVLMNQDSGLIMVLLARASRGSADNGLLRVRTGLACPASATIEASPIGSFSSTGTR